MLEVVLGISYIVCPQSAQLVRYSMVGEICSCGDLLCCRQVSNINNIGKLAMQWDSVMVAHVVKLTKTLMLLVWAKELLSLF